jgi:hypothetical protein
MNIVKELFTGVRPRDVVAASIATAMFYGYGMLGNYLMRTSEPTQATSKQEPGHQILPIYDEKDTLIGFTHPSLVEKASQMRGN